MLQTAAEQRVKRRLGRPPKDPADRRTERQEVYFSVAEKLKLRNDAQACGMSPAAYIRSLVAGHRPTARAGREADPQLLLELNAIGNNLNQTVRFISQGTPHREDWLQLKRLLLDTLDQVALEGIAVTPRLLMRLNAAGTLLNRAVADLHAGSKRSHDWRKIRLSLQELLLEIATGHVR